MSLRRGYFRLAVAVVGGWIAVWACVGAFAAWQQGFWSNLFIEASRAGRNAEATYAVEHANYYGKLVGTAIWWGIMAVPLALIFAIGWWVIRGFTPSVER